VALVRRRQLTAGRATAALPGRPGPGVLALVALGGMLGASGRWALTEWLPPVPGRFPWATFWANVGGSFVLGVVLAVVVAHPSSRPWLRPFAATGVLGALTTMSTYQVETALLLADGYPATAFTYVIASTAGGVGLAWAGTRTGRRAAGSPRRVAP